MTKEMNQKPNLRTLTLDEMITEWNIPTDLSFAPTTNISIELGERMGAEIVDGIVAQFAESPEAIRGGIIVFLQMFNAKLQLHHQIYETAGDDPSTHRYIVILDTIYSIHVVNAAQNNQIVQGAFDRAYVAEREVLNDL